ncbi:hypothetical protein CkaCkLH20_10055 [Colletotrichum karsti]|uniref:Uncharacterized protein n=1 Tax=Colletotrichum karsti TaxID=1095194 RepID=A0A9P6HW56_9PEZI|nr:uncharacterized protein CkaCkLH20_10055 [Colletotrichum karsti]KAF9872558.1 hypothetical protein CkaCkLH20_10055 [Colletotrichum karsti]
MVSVKNIVLLLSASLQVAAATCKDYGSWYIHIRLDAGAQGHRQGRLRAEHSKIPGNVTSATWLYDPETQKTTYTTDDFTLNNTLIDSLGIQDFEIFQTVDGVPLKGSGPINIYFAPAANGRGGEGNTTIVSQKAF